MGVTTTPMHVCCGLIVGCGYERCAISAVRPVNHDTQRLPYPATPCSGSKWLRSCEVRKGTLQQASQSILVLVVICGYPRRLPQGVFVSTKLTCIWSRPGLGPHDDRKPRFPQQGVSLVSCACECPPGSVLSNRHTSIN